ncbi:PrsW family intramembrane metalloprotease [Dolichospermum flos-aquae]|uniref:PrsW family intramembrane metalloprotease n=1 Tax=Dolichospermum flos-aquae LEGE 04289 TaxID=1828708 RepID=A0ACC5PXT0_DOLFA|nr:PrsW family glutamic-type intramembrane protease [Dolichospermum flos-aquae]MBE9217379.1 PrsW family intramembrane metalloprotease [Dolichospermum flos-aquae LEGE 04289]
MDNLLLVLWAVIPPLLFLWFYYRRTPAAPPVLNLLILFIIGAISGFVALGLEFALENTANWLLNWQQIQRHFSGMIFRQILAIAPIEEGCKLVAVILPICYLQRQYYLRCTTVFLFTIAVALGFAAEETWIYLFNGTSSILERTIGTPVHVMFSAPWGYALAVYIGTKKRCYRDRNLIFTAWLNSVFFHALVNILSIAGRFPQPLYLLTYGLFPLLLWMFWRWEKLLRKLQGKRPLVLISGHRSSVRNWQKGLVLLMFFLGGNSIFRFLILYRKISPLRWELWFEPAIFWFIIRDITLNLCLGVLAWLIYRYLRNLVRPGYFFNNQYFVRKS